VGTDGVERGEPVDLARSHHQCMARWRNQHVAGYRGQFIRTGTLEDGRWFVEMISMKPPSGTQAYSSRELAWAVILTLMRAHPESTWTRIPCYGKRINDPY
jgi:hypothetical protein